MAVGTVSADPFGPAAEIARRLKLEAVRGDGDGDLRTTAIFARGGTTIGRIMVGPGPDAARDAAYMAAMMFRTELVLVVADAYMRVHDLDDITPIDTRQGSVRAAWAAGEREGLTECLFATRIPADGPATLQQWPYVREGTTIAWGTPDADEVEVFGAIVDYAKGGYAAAKAHWPQILRDIPSDLEGTLDRAAARLASERLNGAVVILHEQIPRRYFAGNLVGATSK